MPIENSTKSLNLTNFQFCGMVLAILSFYFIAIMQLKTYNKAKRLNSTKIHICAAIEMHAVMGRMLT